MGIRTKQKKTLECRNKLWGKLCLIHMQDRTKSFKILDLRLGRIFTQIKISLAEYPPPPGPRAGCEVCKRQKRLKIRVNVPGGRKKTRPFSSDCFDVLVGEMILSNFPKHSMSMFIKIGGASFGGGQRGK